MSAMHKITIDEDYELADTNEGKGRLLGRGRKGNALSGGKGIFP